MEGIAEGLADAEAMHRIDVLARVDADAAATDMQAAVDGGTEDDPEPQRLGLLGKFRRALRLGD